MTLADDDAQSTQSVVHINVPLPVARCPLHARNAHDATTEFANLLNAAALEETWTFVTVSYPDGKWSGKASPFIRAIHSEGWNIHPRCAATSES
ncbi:hypothetical protein GCM10009837_68040 [Streptomyces durmitorensis]|uniref:Uncharacterized protein n=1 Tax=Streptomyces durmitorensis TaxID=319947 RepID=A0ABY4Q4Y1_9ACTN|nr:hypothetical protein [Streptomyces durmitorensis]UQT61275.1 hypothetical protein M4V62_42860 [Streptomyces durmitorensis]